jgi:CubicO group peptidase (beta-lactamase class C family)
MKGIIPLFILSFAGLSLDTQAQSDIPQKSVNEIDAFCTSLSEQYKFSGSVLIATKGEVVLQKGYGWKDVSKHQQNAPEGIYQIGSLTKSFTAQVILKLMEDGKISLSDPLNKYFPLIYPGSNITIKHLLTHTSGIPTFDIDEGEDTIAFHPVPKDTMLKLITNRPLLFSPGDKFNYSNTGYFLLGLIIEKVTGESYQEIVRKLIFDPLNMRRSGFDFNHLPDTLKATGYKEYQIPSSPSKSI